MSLRASKLLEIDDRWAALQLDSAVMLVGRAIENALQEQINRGDDKDPKWESKYELDDLLEDDFRFPPPPKPPTEAERQMAAIEVLRGWARMTSAVKSVKVQ